jgi:hypothetical protein
MRDPQATLPRKWVFIEGPGRTTTWQVVKSQESRYVLHAKGSKAFYDLFADLYELTNVATDPAYATQVAEAQDALAELRP